MVVDDPSVGVAACVWCATNKVMHDDFEEGEPEAKKLKIDHLGR
jgi:hypothetical protein